MIDEATSWLEMNKQIHSRVRDTSDWRSSRQRHREVDDRPRELGISIERGRQVLVQGKTIRRKNRTDSHFLCAHSRCDLWDWSGFPVSEDNSDNWPPLADLESASHGFDDSKFSDAFQPPFLFWIGRNKIYEEIVIFYIQRMTHEYDLR